LPAEAWCNILGFVLRSHCLTHICAVSKFYRKVSLELLSWEGATVYVRAAELEEENGRPRFDPLIPKWSLASHVFADFKDAFASTKRIAVRRCFSLLGQHCSSASGLYLRNWCLMEKDGLTGLKTCFRNLRHLELSGCDFMGHSNCALLFKAHPALLSFRATFAPKATMTPEVVEAAPEGLKALGFVNFAVDAPELLTRLLERCQLEHLWFARTAQFSPGLARALQRASRPLKTISLPETIGAAGARGESEAEGAEIAALARGCPDLELLCCWGQGLGLAELQEFERLPCESGLEHRIVLRRRGSSMKLAANGGLWAPYEQSDADLIAEEV